MCQSRGSVQRRACHVDIQAMSSPADTLRKLLLDAQHEDGSWSYGNSTGAAEPTALACLALAAHEQHGGAHRAALSWLVSQTTGDGRVLALPQVPESSWPTPLCILAWLSGTEGDHDYGTNVSGACDWLLAHGGAPSARNPRLFGHDTTLVGWSWVPGTHSWVEPTGYAILALRAAGFADHPRTRGGVQLLLNRVIEHGGWNYGNTRVIDHMLRPFPATTGVALTALAHLPRSEAVDDSSRYLTRELERIGSPMSVAWGLIGLRACRMAKQESAESTVTRVLRESDSVLSPLHVALLLLSLGDLAVLTTGAGNQ